MLRRGGPVTPLGPSASVRVGGYSLEVGTHAGSFAQFEPAQETDNADKLKAVLAEEPDEQPTMVAAVEEFEESAGAVTERIERADHLLEAVAKGQQFELTNLTGEINGLLGLLGRLDRAGRFEEELALARSLNGLLVLTLRWLELVRSLRALLGSAQAAGHRTGQAWAHHELGSLHLCAAESEKASQHLGEALRIEEQLGDLAGRCVTRHNLDSARRDLAPGGGRGGSSRRLLRLAGLATAFAVLGAGATGIALAIRDGDGPPSVTTTATQTDDTRPPSTPAGLQAKAVSSGQIDLSWSKSSDNVAVAGYVVYRDGAKLRRVSGTPTSYEDTTVAASTTYVYTVAAVDVAGNGSPQSKPAKVTTPAAKDARPPSTPTGLRAKAVNTTEIDLTWSASSDNVAVTGYVIYRNRERLTKVAGTSTSYRDTAVTPSTGYSYTVQAVDAAGNVSGQSNVATAKTPAPDTTPPSRPTGLKASAFSATEIDLTWLPSTDNVAVTGYIIYRDHVKLTTVAATPTSFKDTTVEPSTGHVYSVQAIDAAGNVSQESSLTKATTPP